MRILMMLMAAVALIVPAEAKSLAASKVKGELVAPDEGSELHGKFSLVSIAAGDRGKEKLYVHVKGLDSELEYEVFLGENLDDATSFGLLRTKRWTAPLLQQAR